MVDILVLGATGYTGRLVVRALDSHPQRSNFSFAIGVRSKAKGEALKKSLGVDASVPLVELDVLHYEKVEAAVKDVKVVMNIVGPYWLYGPNVVKACAVHGKRYVDLAGELPFQKKIISKYDFLATKTGAIIVPACGIDSIPSDILVYLSSRTLKKALGPSTQLGLSQTFYHLNGGFSGGTFATLFAEIEDTPRWFVKEAHRAYSLSPVRGLPPPAAVYATPVPFASPARFASYWVLSPPNTAVVQRSFGLREVAASSPNAKETEVSGRYGSTFRYAEYMVTGASRVRAAVLSATLFAYFAVIFNCAPIRWIVKKILPSSGQGPSEKQLKSGWMTVTNYTESASSPGTYAKSVVRGQGDPGYVLTSHMIVESALALLFDDAALPAAAHGGGILTPSTAFGNVIVDRLEASGHLHFESEILTGTPETKKHR